MRKIIFAFLIVLSVFVLASCSPEPNNTAAPAAGEIPDIPSPSTPLASVTANEMEVLSQIFEDLLEYIGTLFGSGSRDLSRDPAPVMIPSFSGTITVTAPAGSTRVAAGDIRNSAFSATITGSGNSLSLVAETTIAVGENPAKPFSISMDDILSGSGTMGWDGHTIVIDADAETITIDGGAPLNDSQIDSLIEELQPAAIGLLNGLSKASVEIPSFVVSFPMEGFALSATVRGSLSLNTVFNPYFVAIDSDELPIQSGSLSIPNLSVSLSTGTFGLSGNLSIDGLSVTLGTHVVEGETELTVRSLSFTKLSLSAGLADELKVSLEARDTSLSMPTDSSLSGSVKVGFGLKVGENSIGLVTGIDIDADTLPPDEEDLSISAQAVVINGKYYNPEQFVAAMMENADDMFK